MNTSLASEKSRDELTEALRCIVESKAQAEYDFCGEQREWHLPRLNKAFLLLAKLFPIQFAEAMDAAKTPYGDPVGGD